MSRIAPQLDFNNKPLAAAALKLATEAHEGQTRKFTGEHYIHHPMRVCQTLLANGIVSQTVLAAALLHDVLEDCDVTPFQISQRLGVVNAAEAARVRRYVELLTNDKSGTRAERKARECVRLAQASADVRCIKFADILDNMPSMVEHAESDFARMYLEEKKALIDAMSVEQVMPGALGFLRSKALTTYSNNLNKLAERDLSIALMQQAQIKKEEAEINAILDEEERMIYAEAAMF